MYINGNLLTSGEKTRLHSDPFGVRTYVPDKCCGGYTLFSPAYGDREYLIDMRGLVVHTWEDVVLADVDPQESGRQSNRDQRPPSSKIKPQTILRLRSTTCRRCAAGCSSRRPT